MAAATETHLIDVEGIKVYFTAPWFIEADKGECLINIDPQSDEDSGSYMVEELIFGDREASYTIEWTVTDRDEDEDGTSVITAAEATITID